MIEFLETNFDMIAIIAISLVISINIVYVWTLWIIEKKRGKE